MGQGKQGIVLQMAICAAGAKPEKVEPELMYREAEIATSVEELLHMLHLLGRKDFIHDYLASHERRTDDGTYPDVEEHRARMSEREASEGCFIELPIAGVCLRGTRGCAQRHGATDEPR